MNRECDGCRKIKKGVSKYKIGIAPDPTKIRMAVYLCKDCAKKPYNDLCAFAFDASRRRLKEIDLFYKNYISEKEIKNGRKI